MRLKWKLCYVNNKILCWARAYFALTEFDRRLKP